MIACHARHRVAANAHPLIVGQAAVFHLNHRLTYNTVFDPETIELLASGKTIKSSMKHFGSEI